jgi:hypothetical protein
MTKTCSQCGSTEVEELNAELSIACENAVPVDTSGKAMLCSACGFAKYLISGPALATIATTLWAHITIDLGNPTRSSAPFSLGNPN